nr:nucleotide-binding alpha-beta plait domain-containing protein [Tanacetum cinerariifolium]
TCWVRAIEVPGWVPDFEEDGEEGYDVKDISHEDDMYGGVSKNFKDVEGESDREEVPKTNFEELKTVVFDSFKMVYRGMTCWVRAIEVPGWVPDFEEDGEEGYDVKDISHEDDMYGGVSKNLKDVEGESDREEVPKTNFEEVKDKQEKDKIGTKPDKNGKRGRAGQCQISVTIKKAEKNKENTNLRDQRCNPKRCISFKKTTRTGIAILLNCNYKG